jgi:hypothetical protein
MTDTRERPPPTHRASRGDCGHPASRVVGLDGSRDLAALSVVLNRIFECA